MLVSQKRTKDPTVKAVSSTGLGRFGVRYAEYMEARNGRILARDGSVFLSSARFAWFNPMRSASVREADVVAVYWINGAFISPEGLAAIDKPLVWRLSDAWPFTGGCHYPGACDGFERACGQCPQLRRPAVDDASHRLWRRKQDAWRALDLTVTAPSRWMADLARRSALFSGRRIEVIPTGVDLECYRPMDRSAARARWGLPQNKSLVVFGAMSPTDDIRKGYRELQQALGVIARGPLAPRVLAVVFGSDSPLPSGMPIPVMSLGRLQGDEALAAAYNCADVVVVPSLEDNLPNVALEAIACGTPVVGFDVCGMPEIVRHRWNGYLVRNIDGAELAEGIRWVLDDVNRLGQLRRNARAIAEELFDLGVQAGHYRDLYEHLCVGRSQKTANE